MSNRKNGFMLSALKGLDLIKYKEKDTLTDIRWKFTYNCNVCNHEVDRGRIPTHFAIKHPEPHYRTIKRLMVIWGLIGEDKTKLENETVSTKQQNEYTCSCGQKFNSKGALYWHRKDTGHPTIKMVEKENLVPI